MDIVYTLSNNYDGDELKYSLRSLVNLPHDRVFFVGGCPNWAKNIFYIPTEQNGTKWENSLNNIRTACQNEISEDFILMNDDFFILEPAETNELNLHMGTLKKQCENILKRNNCPTNYMKGLQETDNFLKCLGVPEPLSYELHIPFVFNKRKLLKAFSLEGIEKVISLQIRSLYGNLYLKGGGDIKDVKVFNMADFEKKRAGKFLSCSESSFNVLTPLLYSKFSNKSDYEI